MQPHICRCAFLAQPNGDAVARGRAEDCNLRIWHNADRPPDGRSRRPQRARAAANRRVQVARRLLTSAKAQFWLGADFRGYARAEEPLFERRAPRLSLLGIVGPDSYPRHANNKNFRVHIRRRQGAR